MREQNLLGQQIGNYRLIRKLGRGGFAEVYLGEHLHLGIQAAIKILHTTLVDYNEVEQFRSEARMVAHLLHPHIVQVLEFGVQDSTPFLVMRYAPGGTLRHRHPKGSQVPLATLVAYVKQIASALQYAHDERLIHRDVKPENMLVGPNQELLLSDFGIALVAQSSRHHSIQEVAGTATYMAPEQFQGKARTASDQYALGVVVYEWLTGKRPFNGSFSEIASQHLFTPPAPLSGQLPGISPAIEQVVLKALAKDPGQRFESIWEFAVAFERACTTQQTDWPMISTQEPSLPLASEKQTYYLATDGPLADPRLTTEFFAEREAPSPAANLPAQERSRPRRLSRRALIAGVTLTGIAGVGIAAGALGWLPSLASVTVPKPDTHMTPLPSSLGSILYIYSGHHDIVEAAAWSPNSKRIASASKDKTVQIWDAANGGNVFNYTGHSNIVAAVAWSPDGKRIASASLDETVQVWDAANGGNAFNYTGHTNSVAAVAWSPDGERIASGGADTTVQVWSASSRVLSFRFTGHHDRIWWVAWSPDGKRIASASADMTVQVWDAANGGNVFIYRGHTGVVDTVAWSPDGTRIASSSYDKTVHVWDAVDGGHPFIYRGHSDKVWSLAWSPDGKHIASASADTTVHIWDVADGSHPFIYRGSGVSLYFVAWSPDGTRIVSGGDNTNLQVWQAT
jgi:WD40 repeat protein